MRASVCATPWMEESLSPRKARYAAMSATRRSFLLSTLGAVGASAIPGRTSAADEAGLLAAARKDGKVVVRQTADHLGRKGAGWGGGVGVLVGLAAPPLLAATVVGAKIRSTFRSTSSCASRPRSASVTFTNGAHSVTATLMFNDRDELVDFWSDDRPDSSSGTR